MAVCEYCKATILKDAESVRDIGKMSAVLEDYSPIQIGTSGVYGSQGFTVIGRIQLKYPAGMWNEWYVMFDDGRNAWLGDASGQYMLTIEKQVEGELPSAVLLAPSREFAIDGKRYTVADVRTAQCIGGQGELPFRVGEGWQARLADMRSGTSFLTLDYSESERPIVYSGQAVTLENLKCQLLRDDEQIKESAGRYRGKASPLDCPSCGSSVSFIPGATTHIVCPSCRAQLDTTGSVAEVIAAGRAMEQIHTTLELGAKATVSGKQYDLIGVMSRRDDEGEGWTEYLMYNARAGFFWLVETSEGWFRADVQDNWPRWSGSTASLGNINFTKLYEYEAEVTYAAGAFNWRVSAGDKVKVVEFESDHNTLAAEITNEEMTWSMSGPVSADQ
ncbi:MAG: hypothetical protein K0S28_2025, partial [Paucimonas sp.]|nr:hypothetical protein [Paucimonas sp.]